MKRTALVLAVFCLPVVIYAGPEPIPSSGKEMKQVAPPVVECPRWSGFYVGGFGGYSYGATNIHPNLDGDWNTDRGERNVIERTAAHDLSTSGAHAGGLIGYNFQFNRLVLGVEATGAYMWLRDSDNTGDFLVESSGLDYSVPSSLKTHYLATFGPRIGYACCRWMPYVTGGLALGDIDFEQSVFERDTGFFHNIARRSDTEVGWFVGGGLEYALTNHLRLRAEYKYADLGSLTAHSVGSAPFQGFTTDPKAELREHNASFALIYGF